MKEKKSFIISGLLAHEAKRRVAYARAAAQRKEREMLEKTSLKDLMGKPSKV